ncbi:hypothetical protein [Treponema sp.]|uniref:hypothetical protein n=1 Tax=Treponema sp. TaxID=166 RepID=UPI003FD807D1
MKLSKKILKTFSVIAMLAASMAVVSCAAEEDDDEENAITGSNNDYSIDFTNNDPLAMYRAYHATFNKHLGGLCQISIDKNSTGEGTIGYIFDLEANPNRAVKDPRTLCIVGFNLGTSGFAKPYVSRFENVTDIQAKNFGTELSENKAKEKEYLRLGSATIKLADCEDNGKYVLTVDVNGNNNTGYVVRIYKGKIEKDALNTATPAYNVTIPKSDIYPKLPADEKIPQQAAAVYVNVFGGKTMKASWHYANTYKKAEVVEE